MDKLLVGLALVGAAWWLWHSRPHDQDDAIALDVAGRGRHSRLVCPACGQSGKPIT